MFAVTAFLGSVQMLAAQGTPPPDAGSVAANYVDRYVERLRAEAHGRLLADQNSRLARSPGTETGLSVRLATAVPEVRQAVAAMLTGSVQPVERDLRRAAQDIDEQVRTATTAWKTVRTAVCERRSLLGRIRDADDTSAASLLCLDDRWFWAAVLAALAGLAGISLHAHRHGLRRRWSGRRGRIGARGLWAAGFVLLAGAVAALGVADRQADQRKSLAESGFDAIRERMAEEAAQLESEVDRFSAEVRVATTAQAGLREASQRSLAAAVPGLAKSAADLGDRALEVGVGLAVLDGLTGPVQADLSELARVQEDLQAAIDASAEHRWQRGVVRAGIGIAVLGLATAGGWLLRRSTRRRQAATASTCPLCLGTIPPGAASQNGNAKQGPTIVRCTNVLDSAKGIHCDYAIRDAYRPMPKLCFPTLGVPRAGKTHWLAMVYWQLNRGNYPASVRFERVRPVESASGEDFDRIVEQILISRLGTTGTQGARIPHPLMFNFSDHDRWGSSNLLVNIFDYSGEVTATLGADDYRRRRAMEADGYFFFLDPTLPAEPQAKALAEFREDLRLLKGLEESKSLRLPLALCVSKIDLLARQSYALPDGGDAVARFYEDLAKIDPSGEGMTLDVIEARSRVVAGLRDTIWPGWQIERAVDDLFGGRVMFFPLTPVGLDGRGESDLSLRTIAPFGLLEPLAWLLQMNGYPVLQ